MKLLMDLGTFSSEHCGGKDEVAYNLLRGFSKLGHTGEVLVVCQKGVKEIVHSIDPGYQVSTLEGYRRRGKIGRIKTVVKRAQYGKKLKRIAAENNCDCVFFTNKPAPPVRMGVPTVLLPHDIQAGWQLFKKKRLQINSLTAMLWYLINFIQCDAVIAISDFDMSELRSYFRPFSKKLIRIYDPIRFRDVRRAEKCEYTTALNIQYEHKNTITLIKAFAMIAKQVNESLILVGRKDFKPKTERQIDAIIAQNGLQDRVVFTGFVDDAELDRIISKTRLYVNPSLFEGFGMTAIEMMGSCVPTIVNDETAQPETTLGLCRQYSPGTDERALATAMLDELQNPTTAAELESIANIVREKYDYVAIAQEYWSVLTQLSEGKQAWN